MNDPTQGNHHEHPDIIDSTLTKPTPPFLHTREGHTTNNYNHRPPDKSSIFKITENKTIRTQTYLQFSPPIVKHTQPCQAEDDVRTKTPLGTHTRLLALLQKSGKLNPIDRAKQIYQLKTAFLLPCTSETLTTTRTHH